MGKLIPASKTFVKYGKISTTNKVFCCFRLFASLFMIALLLFHVLILFVYYNFSTRNINESIGAVELPFCVERWWWFDWVGFHDGRISSRSSTGKNGHCEYWPQLFQWSSFYCRNVICTTSMITFLLIPFGFVFFIAKTKESFYLP